jgi:hypothetical protein
VDATPLGDGASAHHTFHIGNSSSPITRLGEGIAFEDVEVFSTNHSSTVAFGMPASGGYFDRIRWTRVRVHDVHRNAPYIERGDGHMVEQSQFYNYGGHPTNTQPTGCLTLNNNQDNHTGTNAIIRFNRFYNCGNGPLQGGHSIQLGDADGAQVYGNVIYINPGGAGIATGPGRRLAIYNNTIHEIIGSGGRDGRGISADASSSGVIVNNIALGNSSGNVVVDSASNYRLSNNVTTGTPTAIWVDPTNATLATRDYRLRAGSPAIDAGTTSICTAADVSANRCAATVTLSSFTGSAPDQGAYEYGAAAPEYAIDQLVFQDDFARSTLGSNWIVEKPSATQVQLLSGVVDIQHGQSTSVYYATPLPTTRVLIEYRARALADAGGAATDLNALWMTRDRLSAPPLSLSDFFYPSAGLRFEQLATYYTGFGSNGNTTFRLRRFYGPGGVPPEVTPPHPADGRVILSEQPPSGPFGNGSGGFLTPGQWATFRLVYFDGWVEVWVNGQRAHQYREQPWDNPPFDQGYFAFRTTGNAHVQYDDLRLYRLRSATALPGDLNGDGVRNLTEVRWMIEMLVRTRPKDVAKADLDHDGDVDLADCQALIKLIVGLP